MYPNKTYEDIFLYSQNSLNQIGNIFAGVFLKKKKAAPESRDAIRRAFIALDELIKKDANVLRKMEYLSSKQFSFCDQEEIKSEIESLFESKEFENFKKIIDSIPSNQQKQFCKELFARIASKLVELRSYITYTISDISDPAKVIALDQALYELSLLNSNLLEEVKSKKSDATKIGRLAISFFILIVKTSGFVKNQVTEDELYHIIAQADETVQVQNREETKELLYALTN